MQTEKNKWIEDVLGSTDDMHRATAPDMTGRILARANSTGSASTMVWRIAASVLLLVALNVTTIYVYNNYTQATDQGRNQDTASLFGLGGGEGSQADLGTMIFGN